MTLKSRNKHVAIVTVTSVLFSPSLPILAEDELHFEEIIVTAQRRLETLQEIPIAVTAFDATSVRHLDLDDMMSMTAIVPGFGMSNFNLGQPQPYIRGIGSNEDSAGGDASVVVYIDGIYVARASASSFNFMDVERIEIMRGPQGTLYGKNAIGGVINVVSQNPKEDFGGEAEVTLGLDELNARELRGKVDVPLTDSLFSSVAVSARKRDGYVKNTFTGHDLQDINDNAIRLQLLYEFADSMELHISVDYEDIDRLGNGRQVFGELALFHDDDPFTVRIENDGEQSRIASGGHIQYSWEVTEDLEFISLTGYRESSYDWFSDAFGLSGDVIMARQEIGMPAILDINDIVFETTHQLSQEFRIAYDNYEGFGYVAGLYFLHENTRRTERFEWQFYLDAAPTNFGTGVDIFDQFEQRNETESAAIYGQMQIDLNDWLVLTAGIRYTNESKDFQNTGTSESIPGIVDNPVPVLISAPYTIDENRSWSSTSGRLALEFNLLDDTMYYVSIDRGFKSGGYQGQAGEAISAATPFDPEFAINYEIGAKSEFWDNSVRLNAALFYVDYSDLQVLQFIQIGEGESAQAIQVTENASDAVSQGLEVEAQWYASASWLLSSTYAYNDTEYKKLLSATGNLSGNNLRNAPLNSIYLASNYQWRLPNDSALSWLLSYVYRDETFQDINNFEINKFGSRELWDTRLTWTNASEKLELALYIKNIDNEEYEIHSFQTGQGANSAKLFAPKRTYGLVAHFEF